MKKIVILSFVVLSAIGCAKKEKTGLRDTLVERFREDQDLKDYKLDPEQVADCVVDEIASSLPGFAGDPRRPQFFEAYERFLSVKSQAEAEQSLKDFTRLFGSPEAARVAATSITDHIMTCMGKAIDNSSTDGHRVQGGEEVAPQPETTAPSAK